MKRQKNVIYVYLFYKKRENKFKSKKKNIYIYIYIHAYTKIHSLLMLLSIKLAPKISEKERNKKIM